MKIAHANGTASIGDDNRNSAARLYLNVASVNGTNANVHTRHTAATGTRFILNFNFRLAGHKPRNDRCGTAFRERSVYMALPAAASSNAVDGVEATGALATTVIAAS